MTNNRSRLGCVFAVVLAVALSPILLAPLAEAVPPAAGTLLVVQPFDHKVVAVAPDGSQSDIRATGLGAPAGVTADGAGNVYISDPDNHRIVRVPADGGPQTDYVSDITKPAGISMDGWGNLYVADAWFNQVLKIAPDGTQTVLVPDIPWPPQDVAINDAGRIKQRGSLYITIPFLVGSSGRVLSAGQRGGYSSIPFFTVNDPTYVAVDAEDKVYVSYPRTGLVIAAGNGGEGGDGEEPVIFQDGLENPQGVAVDDVTGNVYVASSDNDTIVEFAPDGDQVGTVPVAGLDSPRAIALVPAVSPPAVDVTTPQEAVGVGMTYEYGSVPDAEFTCTAGLGAILQAGLRGCSASIDGGPAFASGTPLLDTGGQHTMVVTAVDNGGRQTRYTVNYRVLTGGPSATITAPEDEAQFMAGSVPDLSFTCDPGPGGILRLGLDGCSASIDGGSPVASGTPLPDQPGRHAIRVTAKNVDGMAAVVSANYFVTAQKPTVSITSPMDGATYRWNSVPNASYSCAAGEGSVLTSCAGTMSGLPVANGEPLPRGLGTHTLRVVALAEDGQSAFMTRQFTVVAELPTVTVTTPADGASFPVGTVPAADFTCAPGAAGFLYVDVGGCSVSVDGGPPQPADSPLVATAGTHTAVFTATQTDGQQASVIRTYAVVGPPTVTIATPADGGSYPVGSVPASSFSCTPATGGTLKPGLEGCSASIDGGDPVASGAPLAESVGSHTITVTASDADGQRGESTHRYTVKPGVPGVTIQTPADGADFPFGSVPDAEFACVAGEGATLADGLEGCSASLDGGPAVASGTALPDSVGAHSLEVTATDTDGQNTSVRYDYTVTALPPTVTITRPSEEQSFAAGSVPDVEFTCTPGDGGALRDGLAGCSAAIDGGAPVAAGSPLADTIGSHSITVTATDVDGQQTSATHVYTVTAVAPAVSVSTPADGATYAIDSVPELAFTCSPGTGGTLKDGLDGCAATIDDGPAVASGTALAGTVGLHTVAITATDVDGQATTVVRSYTVAALPPSATITTPADGVSFQFGDVPDVEFACTAGSGGALADGLAGCSATVDGGAPIASGAALPDTAGTHLVTVTAAGTDGQHASVTSEYTVVALAPSATIATPTDGATFVFGAAPNAEFACTAGAGGALVNGLAGCSATVDGGAPFGSGTALPDTAGDHVITVTATGADGQTATMSAAYSVAAAPTAMTATAQSTLVWDALPVEAKLTSGEQPVSGASIRFSAGTTELCTATTTSAGTATCELTGDARTAALRAGEYQAVFAGDASYLESSATTTAEVTVDLTADLPPSDGQLDGVPAETRPGQQLRLSATGFAPHSPVVFGIYSSGTVLARAIADDGGHVEADVTIPDAFSGPHAVIAVGPDDSFEPFSLQAATTVSSSDTGGESGDDTGSGDTGGDGGGGANESGGGGADDGSGSDGSAGSDSIPDTGVGVPLPPLVAIVLACLASGAGVLVLAGLARRRA